METSQEMFGSQMVMSYVEICERRSVRIYLPN